MGLTLRWGLGVGAAIVLIDFLAAETARGVAGTDLAVAIQLIDLLANLGLFGWVGYRVARALGQLRAGLEAAVLAGLLAGCAQVVYHFVREAAPPSNVTIVSDLAWNVVLAAGPGALGAWMGGAVRRDVPPGKNRGPHP